MRKMIDIGAIRIATRLLALVVLASCLWFFAGTPVRTQKTATKRSLPVQARQLDPVGGVLQVELRCDDAKLSGTGRINEASCVIKNNTFAPMVAGTLEISVTLEQAGITNSISGYETFDTFLHPDFREDHKNNLIQPGMVYRFDLMPANYGDAIVKKIEAEVDYIEFADKTSVGPNHVGARKINDIREGAAKYKNWLVRKYKEKSASINSVIELLDNSETTSLEEVGLRNEDQQSGASMYRKFARRTYQANGPEGLTKHLKKN
jgi:hypothetical protein